MSRRNEPGDLVNRDVSSSLGKDAEAALALLEEALNLIDRFDGPGEIGAYVDLAIHQLRQASQELPAEQASKSSGLTSS